MAQLLNTQYLNNTIRIVRKRGLDWLVGSWDGDSSKHINPLKTIKDNIRTLQEHNLLQQNQIIELNYYLNITYRYVSSNRCAITNLQIRMTEVNKTLTAALSNVKFVKYSVAIINDIRIVLAKLTLGVISLEQNVNATCKYLRVLSSRQVNPLIIPPDFSTGERRHEKEPKTTITRRSKH